MSFRICVCCRVVRVHLCLSVHCMCQTWDDRILRYVDLQHFEWTCQVKRQGRSYYVIKKTDLGQPLTQMLHVGSFGLKTLIYATFIFRKTRRQWNFSEVENECTSGQIHMCVACSPHWNLIGRGMTTPSSLLLSPSNILPPCSHCALITSRKSPARLKNVIWIGFPFKNFVWHSVG